MAGCSPQASFISTNFNGTSINIGNDIWFSANFTAKGIPSTGATIFFQNAKVTIASKSGAFTYTVPNGKIVFTASATCATTMFDGTQWVTTVPINGSDEILLSALGIKAPADLKSATVTWTGSFSADTKGISLNWKAGSAVYTVDMTQPHYNDLGAKPTHTKACQYNDSEHAGTPENEKKYLVAGASGGGGSNYTGSWSGTVSVKLCPGN